MLHHEITTELQTTMRKLKLGPMLVTLPERLRQCRDRQMDVADLLQIVFSDEVQRRTQLATSKRVAAAGLEPSMVLEAWDKTAAVTFDRALLDKLATLQFIQAHQHVLCMGPVGVGKTFIAHALGHVACRHGLSVVCEKADKLFKSLKSARLDQSHAAEMRRLFSVDLLIIDDFGQRPLDSLETSDIYEIIDERHRKRSMIVTSNREPLEWLPLLADSLHAQAAVDRFTNNAHDLVVEGQSYRLRQKPKN